MSLYVLSLFDLALGRLDGEGSPEPGDTRPRLVMVLAARACAEARAAWYLAACASIASTRAAVTRARPR